MEWRRFVTYLWNDPRNNNNNNNNQICKVPYVTVQFKKVKYLAHLVD